MKSKSIAVVKKGKAELVERRVPALGPDDVLVQVKVCGICASDPHFMMGMHEEGEIVRKSGYPFFLGHEPAGIVMEKGKHVKKLKVGDPVTFFAVGAASEYLVAPQEWVEKIPGPVQDFAVWISEPPQCAVNGLRCCKITYGESVAVIGCGYMGLLNLQALPRAILSLVAAVDIDPWKLECANQWADVTVNAAESNPVESLRKLRPEGFDVVVEASGVPGTIDTALALLKQRGRLSLFGWHHGSETINTTRVFQLGACVIGTAPGSSTDLKRDFRDSVTLMARRTINQTPLITHRYRYDRNPTAALKEALSRPKGYIKGVFEMITA